MKLNNAEAAERAVTMYYYAFLNERDVVEMVISLPSQITDPKYISIPTNDQSLVGKHYNRVTGEFEDVMFYYAFLDDKDIVIDVVALPSEVSDPKKILVPTYDKSIVGKWYNRATGKFEEVPIHILAKMNTGEINTLKADGTPEDKWLQTKLNELDAKIQEVAMGGIGAPKSTFRIKHNEEMDSTWQDGKRLTFSFNSGIPNYLPKKIRITDKRTSSSLVLDLYVNKDTAGNITSAYAQKSYIGVNYANKGGTAAWMYDNALEMTDSTVLEMGLKEGKKYNTGAEVFVDVSFTNDHSVEIGQFEYTENSISFVIRPIGSAIGSYTYMDLYGSIY